MLNVQCIICIGAIDQSSDVYCTPCGHMFHYGCLLQWLQKKKTCPQCRASTNEHKIKRLFFNFSNNDTIIEDTTSLQQIIDELKFKIVLNNEEIKKDREKIAILETQTDGLRKEVRKVEKELGAARSLVHSLKDQAKHFKEQAAKAEQFKKEAVKFREEVEKLKNVQDIITAAAEEVDSIIARTKDPSALVTYISVIKREMTTMMSKTKEHRAQIRSLKMELSQIHIERNALLNAQDRCKKLENELQACENQKIMLQNKVHELSGSASSSKNPAEGLRNLKKPNKLKKDIIVTVEPTTYVKSDTLAVTAADDKSENLDEGEHSPYLPVKSQGILAIKRGHALRSIAGNSNIGMTKKRGLSQVTGEKSGGSEQYDGFGSHSKYEHFPEPIPSKSKRPKDDPIKTQKQKQLSNFVSHV